MSPLETEKFGEHVPMLVADRQARHGVMPPWRNGKTAKEFRAVLGRKPMVGLFGVGLEEQYRWKDSVQSDAEIRIWALDGLPMVRVPGQQVQWYSARSTMAEAGRRYLCVACQE